MEEENRRWTGREIKKEKREVVKEEEREREGYRIEREREREHRKGRGELKSN